MLNVKTCTTTPSVPGETTNPGGTTDPNPVTNPSDPDPTPPADTTAPSVAIDADPLLAGGTTHVITITGMVVDDNLSSYSLTINGNVAQAESNMTTGNAGINIAWNVAPPNVVASGIYEIRLDATDKAGNTAHKEILVEVDNTPPTVSLSGGDVIIKSGSISPTTAADDTHGIASYAWTADADNPASLEYDATVAEPNFMPSVQGTYVFYLTVTDGLGNITTRQFSFDYVQEFETIPLPTTQSPTDGLVDQSPSTLAATQPTATPTIRSGRDEITASDDDGVLGNTISSGEQSTTPATVATIAATDSGWSIFGFLWYWWLIVIGAFFAGWIGFKKYVSSRLPEHS